MLIVQQAHRVDIEVGRSKHLYGVLWDLPDIMTAGAAPAAGQAFLHKGLHFVHKRTTNIQRYCNEQVRIYLYAIEKCTPDSECISIRLVD